jgi:hypothetical protein
MKGYFVFFIGCFLYYHCIEGEQIILRNGKVIEGEISEITENGIKINIGKTKTEVIFKWHELDENFAKKIYLRNFNEKAYNRHYFLGIEVKKVNDKDSIKGIEEKSLNSQNFIFLKTNGKVIKIDRKEIEYVKPAYVTLFDVYGEKGLYFSVIGRNDIKIPRYHLVIAKQLKKYNLNIYKFHLLLYIIKQFPSLEIYSIYTNFHKIFKEALESKNLCVFEYLLNKNWNTITLADIYKTISLLATQCSVKDKLTPLPSLDEKKLINYSLLTNSILNLFVISYSSITNKEIEKIVDDEFNETINDLSFVFSKPKKYIKKVWGERNFKLFKIEGCDFGEYFYLVEKKWEKLRGEKRFIILLNTFINRQLKTIARGISKDYTNFKCYIYVAK